MAPTSAEYFHDLAKKFGFSFSFGEFQAYVKKERKSVESIPALKKLLTTDVMTSEREAQYKKLFIEMGIIFIKFYSVKWIYSSRLSYKHVYLKFRFMFER